MTKRSSIVAALFALLLGSQAHAASTINTAVPAVGANLSSGPIRNNFVAAASDINGLLGMFAGPSQPSNPSTFQFWANTGTNPVQISQFDGTTWVLWGTIDPATHVFSPFFGNAITGAAPITVTGTTSVVIGLNLDSNFVVSGGNLAFNPIAAGRLLANSTSGTAEPTTTTLTAWVDRACGSTQGLILTRTTSWVCANAINQNAAAAPAGDTGVILQGVGADTFAARFEVTAFAAGGVFTARRADGTGASPSALLANDIIGAFNFHGYQGSNGWTTTAAASIEGFADANWSNTSWPTHIDIATTPSASTTKQVVARFQSGGGMSLFGAASGSTSITPASAASGAWTLPSVTDQFVGRATTDALTNKTYNGNTWTAGSGTLAIGAGKTATINNTLTFSGLDSASVAYGGSFATAAAYTMSGAFAFTGTLTGVTTVTFPTSGTLVSSATSAGGDLTGTYPNPTLLATVNANVGTFGSATVAPIITANAKGQVTAVTTATIAPPFSAVTGQATLAQLPNATSNTVLGCNSGCPAAPSLLTASNVLDMVGNTRGAILYRGASGWAILPPDTSGKVLTTQGAGADPIYTTVSGTGTVTNVATGTGLTGGPITTTGTIAVTGVLADLAGISWSQGDIIYYNGTNLVRLPAGTSGQLLKTQGAGANPLWATVAGSGTVTNVASGYGLSGGPITATGTLTAPLIASSAQSMLGGI